MIFSRFFFCDKILMHHNIYEVFRWGKSSFIQNLNGLKLQREKMFWIQNLKIDEDIKKIKSK